MSQKKSNVKKEGISLFQEGQLIPEFRVKKYLRVARQQGVSLILQHEIFDFNLKVVAVKKIEKKETEKEWTNIEETKAHLMKLETVEEIEKEIENETRKGVLEFANELINELKK